MSIRIPHSAVCALIAGLHVSGAWAQISVGDADITEGNSGTSALTFTLDRAGSTIVPLMLRFRTEDAGALAGSDYTAVPLSERVWPAGAATQTVDVTVAGDAQFESDETFLLSLVDAYELGNAHFSSAVQLATGKGPNAVALGDMDGDGKLDLVVANETVNSFSVILNDSESGSLTADSFGAKNDFVTANANGSVALADLDGDGKLDVILTQSTTHRVSVRRNNSTMGAPAFDGEELFTTANNPVDVVAVDLNADSKLDLVTANFSGSISVFENTAASGVLDTGSFAARADYSGMGTQPISVIAKDLDADGKPDVAVAALGSNAVMLRRNLTATNASFDANSFSAATSHAVAGGPRDLQAADLDGDDRPELMTANSSGMSVSVLRNISAGAGPSFEAKQDYALTGLQPFAVTVADFDDDDRPDLVFATAQGVMAALRNTDDAAVAGFDAGSFAAPFSYVSGAPSLDITSGDLDGDGDADLAVLNDGVTVLRGTPLAGQLDENSFSGSLRMQTGNSPSDVALVDIDGDGKRDLVVAVGSGLMVHRNLSAAGAIDADSFGAGQAFNFGGSPTSVAAADFDGDGRMDLVVGDSSFSAVHVMINQAAAGVIGSSSLSRIQLSARGNSDVIAADLDGDGKPDIAASVPSRNSVVVLSNIHASGTLTTDSFATFVETPMGTRPVALAVADLDGDDKPELVTADFNGDTVSVLRNLSSGTGPAFSTMGVNYTVGDGPNSIAIADFDGDGKADIVTRNQNEDTLTVLRNMVSVPGDFTGGSFAAAFTVSSGKLGQHVIAVDLDRDGKTDLVDTSSTSSTLSYHRNQASSGTLNANSFAAPAVFPLGSSPLALAAGDLDGDSKSDLVATYPNENMLSVLRSQPVYVTLTDNEATGTILNDDAAPARSSGGALPLSLLMVLLLGALRRRV